MSYRASVEEIEPGFLFLGNIKARDPEILNELGIRYVLNAANADLDEMAPLPEEKFKVFTLNLLDGTQLSAEDGRVRDGLTFIDEVGDDRTPGKQPGIAASYEVSPLLPCHRRLCVIFSYLRRQNSTGQKFWSIVRLARTDRPRCCWRGCSHAHQPLSRQRFVGRGARARVSRPGLKMPGFYSSWKQHGLCQACRWQASVIWSQSLHALTEMGLQYPRLQYICDGRRCGCGSLTLRC